MAPWSRSRLDSSWRSRMARSPRRSRRSTTPPGGTTTTASTVSNGTYQVGNQVIVFTYSGTTATALGSLTSGGLSIQNGLNSFEYVR